MTTSHIDQLLENIAELQEEVDRLKRGDFTEEEFQNLCNGLSEEVLCRFKKGCSAYWRKLEGIPEVDPSKVFIISQVWSLFDDESVHKKLPSMTKAEVMNDDARNEPQNDDDLEKMDEWLQLGKKYKVEWIFTEIGEAA